MTTLTTQPSGIDSTSVIWERSKKYWGMFPSFTASMVFTKEAALLLRTEFYTNGLNGYYELQIRKLNNLNALTYFDCFIGGSPNICDFTKFVDSDFEVSINIKKAGYNAGLSQNGDTDYTIIQLPDIEAYLYPDVVYPILGYKPINIFKALANYISGGNGVYSQGNWFAKSDFINALSDADPAHVLLNGKGFTWRNSSGAVFKTADTGDSFTSSIDNFFADLLCVHFPSTLVGYVGGQGGIVLKTIDGGITWTVLITDISTTINSIFFITTLYGWVVGEGGYVYVTANGGMTWWPRESGTLNILRSVYFFNAAIGFICGDGGIILKTIDQGVHWIQKASGTTEDLNCISCLKANSVGYSNGLAWTGGYGVLLKSIDYGETWNADAFDSSPADFGSRTLKAIYLGWADDNHYFGLLCGEKVLCDWMWMSGGWNQDLVGGLVDSSETLLSISYYGTQGYISGSKGNLYVGDPATGPQYFNRHVTPSTSSLNGVFTTDGATAYLVGLSSTLGHPTGLLVSSMSAFFDSHNAIWPLGMGVETIAGHETLVLEEREHFFNPVIIATVQPSSKLRLSVNEDLIYNTVKIGFPESSYKDELTADKEVCEWSIFGFKFTNNLPKKQLEIISKYRADGQGMIELVGAGNISQSWNDFASFCTFMSRIAQYGDKWIFQIGPVMDGLTLTQAQIPGVFFSPRRTLDRYINWISDLFPGWAGKALFFLSGYKNQYLIKSMSIPETRFLNERKMSAIVAPSVITPFSLEFEARYDVDMISKVNANPGGLIAVDYLNNMYYGYIDKNELVIAGEGSVSYKLIPTPPIYDAVKNPYPTDLTKLIR